MFPVSPSKYSCRSRLLNHTMKFKIRQQSGAWWPQNLNPPKTPHHHMYIVALCNVFPMNLAFRKQYLTNILGRGMQMEYIQLVVDSCGHREEVKLYDPMRSLLCVWGKCLPEALSVETFICIRIYI